MRRCSTALCLLVLAAVPAAAKDAFRVKSARDYPAHQKQGEVVVAVKPYRGEKETKRAFGKVRPLKHGVLPVLVVITNGSDHALSLEKFKVRFITDDRQGLEPISSDDLAYYRPGGLKEKPRYIPSIPGIGRPRAKKGPLARSEIVQREFKAPIVAPQTTVSGFFYYVTGSEPDPVPGASVYLTGFRDLTTGRDLFYFEIPLDPYR